MSDPRFLKLADVLVRHSTRLAPGEKVLIETFDVDDEMVCALIDRVAEAGALPFVETRRTSILRRLYRSGTDEQMALIGEHETSRMRTMDAYIGIRGALNSLEMSDVSPEKMGVFQKNWQRPVTNWRVDNTRWCVLRWPTPSFAQAAGMSTEAFTNFYFDVCTLDYAKMEAAQQPLAARMRDADRVKLTGKDTELTFSMQGIGSVICAGLRNIPDGECYSCPTRDSVNGEIVYNAGTIYQGTPFDNVRLVFKDGKIIDANAGSETKRLNAILDSDEGARYIGEFSLGFNPHILKPMRDILFDEKINGSFHFTPGQAYRAADNGNRSQVHWDMVFIQRPEFGGGDVYFDDELIRRDGRFVPGDLQGLNPENLI